MDDKRFYRFELDDYSAASFTSFTKPYFGTTKQFKELVDCFDDGQMEEVENAFYHFAAGDESIEYYAGQIKTRFATPIEVLASRDIEFGATSFNHKNTWGYFYCTKNDGIKGKLYLGKEGDSFFLFYNVQIKNLRYTVEKDDARWMDLDGDYWGFPHQLKPIKIPGGFIVKTMLCPLESKFDNETEARKRFESAEQLDLKYFLEDCFADG